MTLDILIPTLPDRTQYLTKLLTQIEKQKNGHEVNILTDDRGKEIPTGTKRNDLLQRATSEYVWQIDDDDELFDGAISNVCNAFETKPDCLAINGLYQLDNHAPKRWFIAISNPYREIKGVYYRFPNHITPMKRELAVQVKFEDIWFQEDYKWACALKEKGLLKTEVVVRNPVYFYRYRSKK